MQPVSEGLVYIVDDDAGVREALAWLLRSRHLLSESFADGETFLSRIRPGFVPAQASCLLLDVRMPGISGLALFEQLTQWALTSMLPVIFLTGHGDVPTAVDAVKRGAFDFCPKPFSDNSLVDRVVQALVLSAQAIEQCRSLQRLERRLTGLTERERDVMTCVVEGLPNKLIADRLGISVRTVEVHRARVFDKMSVSSAVELANLLRVL